MYIHKIKLHNFKGFSGEHEFVFSKGINFLVGDNNCGKTTIFRSIEFLQNGGDKDSFINNSKNEEHVSVEIEIAGNDLRDFIENTDDSNVKKYKSAIIDNSDGTFSLKIIRSSEEDVKKIKVYIPDDDEYKNLAGFDKAIKVLFDAQFVYSDLNNNDYQDFSKTKIIGRLIDGALKGFRDSDEWKEFERAHKKAFGENGLRNELQGLEKQISDILEEQYGEGELKIQFDLPAIESFSKAGSLELKDSGGVTGVSDKGTGMQRALALSLIQVYASVNNEDSKKPIFFFIDEPETFLHPMAQNKLLEAFENLSNRSQLFITTHSPYLLKKFKKDTHKLMIYGKDEGGSNILKDDNQTLNLFGESSPTWGEVNYFAFGVLSAEFHNELYGFLQAKAIDEDQNNYYEENFDKWLIGKGFAAYKNYIRLKKDGTTDENKRTLPTYIRNLIHHPENQHNQKYSDNELRESIKMMVGVLHTLTPNSKKVVEPKKNTPASKLGV